jgi:tRNA1(Val) A37 N6-methylase TrmN6
MQILQAADSWRSPPRWHRLELGAGGGLVGFAVARGCHTNGPVYVTDQEVMLSLMQHNMALNNLQGKAQAAVLNW